MADDTDWVADVRRWYFSSQQASARPAALAEAADQPELGYEAAHPTLQARHWPDAPVNGGDLG